MLGRLFFILKIEFGVHSLPVSIPADSKDRLVFCSRISGEGM